MREVIWSPEAEDAQDAYIDWLVEYDEQTAKRIQAEIEAWTLLLSKRPLIGNAARWPGFRVHGDRDLDKLMIYEVFDDHIEIVAFRDMRQDNSKLRLRPKTK
ncbi:MAG: type II toxin-antitoxin system RelE/ParE family toxin [Pseudomonadota bacterium]